MERNELIAQIQSAMMGAEVKLSAGDIANLVSALNKVKDPEDEKKEEEAKTNKK